MTPSTSGRTGRTALLATTTGVVLSGALCLTAGIAQAAPAAPAVGSAAATTAAAASSSYDGDAFGSSVSVGNVVRSGRSAPVVLGCTTQAGISRTNSTVGLSVPLLARSGTVSTTATTASGPATARTTARTEGLNLLTGVVTADVVEAASATSRSGGAFSTSSAGSTFLHLRIAGQGMPASPAANTRVDLPGLGYVVLNEQVVTKTAMAASLSVNALHLVITRQPVGGGIAVGTNVIVSHARSGLSAPVSGLLGGAAYGTRLDVATVVGSGPSFQRVMPCLGTDGVVRATTGVGVTLPGALTSGTIRNTVEGTVTDTTVQGQTTSTVDATNLLDGLVRATVVKAVANGAKSATGARTFSSTGSGFGTLSVTGFSGIDANVRPNTELTVDGVGTLYLNHVIRTNGRIEVRMVELVLSAPSGTLPAGASLRSGVASVSVS